MDLIDPWPDAKTSEEAQRFLADLRDYVSTQIDGARIETIPGTGVANGNPPSGVAAGYVFFDIVALALAPAVLAFAQSLKRHSKRRFGPARAAPCYGRA